MIIQEEVLSEYSDAGYHPYTGITIEIDLLTNDQDWRQQSIPRTTDTDLIQAIENVSHTTSHFGTCEDPNSKEHHTRELAILYLGGSIKNANEDTTSHGGLKWIEYEVYTAWQ